MATGVVLVGAALVGFGVGASVSPALFLTGFSLVSDNLPRVFAFVELLRAVAALLFALVLVQFATTRADTAMASWIVLALVGVGLLVAVAVAALGRLRLHEPDVDTWLAGDRPAIPSERFAARLRSREPAGG